MKKYRLIPVDPYHITAVEDWLTNMSKKGFSLVRIGGFAAVFERSSEPPAVYRLLPFAGEEPAGEAEQAESSIPNGWYDVTEYKNYFKIYRRSNPDAKEPEFDPAQTAAVYNAASRRAAMILACLSVSGIAILAVLTAGFLMSDWPLMFAAEGGFTAQLLALLLYLAAGLPWAQEAAGLRRLLGQLREAAGRSVSGHRPGTGHRTGILRLIVPAFSLIFLALAGGIGFTSLSRQLQEGIPASVSSLLSSANEWFLTMEEPTESLDSVESSETAVSYGSSPFARSYCQISLTASVPGRTWQGSELEYSPSLRIRFYDLSVSWLAEPLLEELIERYTLQTNITGRLASQELSPGPFDRLVLAEDDAGTTCLFGLKDHHVILVLYYGEAGPEQDIDELYGLIDAAAQ